MKKLRFKILVKQIENGFIVSLEDDQDIKIRETFSPTLNGIVDLVKKYLEIVEIHLNEGK